MAMKLVLCCALAAPPLSGCLPAAPSLAAESQPGADVGTSAGQRKTPLGQRPEGARPVSVILDTDIGGDIDDTWALVMLLKTPELDCRLVTTCTGDTTYRAKVVAKLLETAKRTDIPIGIGPAQHSDLQPQAEWVRDYDLSSYPGKVHADGAGALVAAVMSSHEPVTIVAIGPFTTIAAALRREPRIAARSRVVAMAGNIRKPFGDAAKAIPEFNVKVDVAASRAVFAAPWEMTITPLDTCGFVKVMGEAYRRVAKAEDALTGALMENYRVWCRTLGRDAWFADGSSILFDTVAVHLAHSEEHLAMEDLRLIIEDDGLTAVSPGGRPVRTAIEWTDKEAFQASLVERLVHGKH
jgi:inosine-uridine nucleoside N-ribohydrolase